MDFVDFGITMAMRPYKGARKDSGVAAYELGPDFIRIEFRGGRTYRYSHLKPGSFKVMRMKQLAERGSGLATFISQYVKDDYECEE